VGGRGWVRKGRAEGGVGAWGGGGVWWVVKGGGEWVVGCRDLGG